MRSTGCGSAPNWSPKTTIPSGSSAWPASGVTFEQLKRSEAMVFADELDIHLLPKVGYAWMPKGSQIDGHDPGYQ